MKQHLTPTVITDVNGRVTTVHKKQDAAGGVRSKSPLPAPSVVTPVKPPQGIPLPSPEPLTPHQRKYFDDTLETFNRHIRVPSMVASVRLDDDSAALAHQVMNSGAVYADVVRFMASSFQKAKRGLMDDGNIFDHDEITHAFHDKLRMAEALGTGYPELNGNTSKSFAVDLEYILNGYRYASNADSNSRSSFISTEEDLAPVVAVSAFILQAHKLNNYDMTKRVLLKDNSGQKVAALAMKNRSLDAHLRKAPHDIDQVLSYIRDRTVGNTVRDTQALLEYMKETEGNTALAEGWL